MTKYKCDECEEEFTNKIDLASHICNAEDDEYSKEREDYNK